MADKENKIPGYDVVDVASELSKAADSAKVQATQMEARSVAMRDVVAFLKSNDIICIRKQAENKEEK